MRIDIRDSKYSIIYNEKTGTVEDVLWCNESAEDLKNLNIVADMARELAVYRQAGVAMFAGAKAIRDLIERGRHLPSAYCPRYVRHQLRFAPCKSYGFADAGGRSGDE